MRMEMISMMEASHQMSDITTNNGVLCDWADVAFAIQW